MSSYDNALNADPALIENGRGSANYIVPGNRDLFHEPLS